MRADARTCARAWRNPDDRHNRLSWHNGLLHGRSLICPGVRPARRRVLHLGGARAASRLPVRTFLPTGYEPNYPYPLLVFFHGHGGNEEQILRLAPRLSRRNYICIGLRGPQSRSAARRRPAAATAGAATAAPTPWSRTTSSGPSSRRAATTTSIPSASTWPASAKGATLAYRLGLTFPETLRRRHLAQRRHAAARPAAVPAARGPAVAGADRPRHRQRRRAAGLARSDYRLLYTAGLDVEMHTYPANHRLHPDMLRDINRWIMRQIRTRHALRASASSLLQRAATE